MLRIRKPRNFSWKTIIFVSLIGTFSGIYIYNPLLRRYVEEEVKGNKSDKQKKFQMSNMTPNRRIMLLCVGALSSLTFFGLAYKNVVGPYFNRIKYLRNQEFADFVFDQEENQQRHESGG